MASEAYQEHTGCSSLFKCPACSQEHETKSEAKSCCPVEQAFTCDECSEEFDERKLAKACCSSWVCEYCGSEFDTKKEAKNCCKDEEEG